MMQSVDFDFQYFATDFHLDAPVLILSSNTPSSLNADFNALIDHPNELISIEHYAEIFPILREYISACKNLGSSYGDSDSLIGDAVKKRIESDFVIIRQRDPLCSQEFLHKSICMAKLYALSWGRKEIAVSDWEFVLNLQKDVAISSYIAPQQ
eukprot:TRINITY_DN2387_c0_g1_i1.p2 TRINITY_DN2387_c0_g1~~TRINITY_DN2387_c0_g1_i1.p2  ORF type:complete len:153 (-),score=42.24 TRINITY_DN2387_c0_g1_i1:5-463(-)